MGPQWAIQQVTTRSQGQESGVRIRGKQRQQVRDEIKSWDTTARVWVVKGRTGCHQKEGGPVGVNKDSRWGRGAGGHCQRAPIVSKKRPTVKSQQFCKRVV